MEVLILLYDVIPGRLLHRTCYEVGVVRFHEETGSAQVAFCMEHGEVISLSSLAWTNVRKCSKFIIKLKTLCIWLAFLSILNLLIRVLTSISRLREVEAVPVITHSLPTIIPVLGTIVPPPKIYQVSLVQT